jgi:cysteine-S-conjugate beta-lyase
MLERMNHPYDALELGALEQKACSKWRRYPEGVLPLWVADMDFPIAEPIKAALREHLAGDNFGYPPYEGLPGLKDAVSARLAARYGWAVAPEEIDLLNGVVPGLFLSVLALSSVGDEVLIPSPIYGPFRMAVEATQRKAVYSEMARGPEGYAFDLDDLAAKITPATRVLMLCNPQNPVGRVFRREELTAVAELALKHRLWVVSDELHADLLFPGHEHIPFASLGEDVAARTLTLFGPTKAFNIAGLKIGFAASGNAALLSRLREAALGLVGQPNVLAQAATLAAYQQGDAWLQGTLAYLDGNRRLVAEFVARELPQVGHLSPEGTYLAWAWRTWRGFCSSTPAWRSTTAPGSAPAARGTRGSTSPRRA